MIISDRTLVKLQAISGLVFATFLVLHLFNTALATQGQSVYDFFMDAVRAYYQFPLIEITVIGFASLLHTYSSVTRGYRRQKAANAKGVFQSPSNRVRFHRYSGYFIFLASSAMFWLLVLPS